jgi:hypothetical protein
MVDNPAAGKPKSGGFLGSLKEALAAASRDDTGLAAARTPQETVAPVAATQAVAAPNAIPAVMTPAVAMAAEPPAAVPPPIPAAPHAPANRPLSAAEAARDARGVTSLKPQNSGPQQERHMEFDGTNTTRIIRGGPKAAEPAAAAANEPARTQLVRGRQPLKRGQFVQDPVVGWLVIVGGPGLGAYRPIFEGNNTIGRAASNRVPLDFGDESISSEEQAYVRYDSNDRSFLFVPNLSKTNIVQVNAKKPTAAVELAAMDVIVMGRTQLVFMPFCSAEFDWSEISESKD